MSDSTVQPEYRVQLDVFSGPLDLLLYLIRRDELDVQDIPVARVAEQYLSYVRLLEEIDPNSAGEFLVLASTLVELKSRALLPSPPLDGEGESDDPRHLLVRQLLEYKRFKDAARTLGTSADERAKRYIRIPANLPPELAGVELEEAQVWDLLAAFNKVMTAVGRGPGVHQVRYDDTPIELHSAEIVALLERDGPMTFQTLFDGLAAKAQIVGKFLAMLELIKKRRLRAEQDRLFGVIYLFLLEEAPDAVESAIADTPDAALVELEEPHAERAIANIPDAAPPDVPTYQAVAAEPVSDAAQPATAVDPIEPERMG